MTDALGVAALRYGRDDHYDVISAFIKSIRGSDPDAGLYWLARMLEAGEDARFIARRLVVLASEDVGMADPTALLVAVAAARAVEHVGLPEAQLNLAQAVVHLATAPKSNRSALGIWNARDRRARGPAAARCRRTCATATTRARRRSATVPATTTRTTTRGAGCPSATCPSSWPTVATTSPAGTASRPRWPAVRRRATGRRRQADGEDPVGGPPADRVRRRERRHWSPARRAGRGTVVR